MVMFTHDVTKYEKDQRCHCQKRAKQESISVGCVPSAAVTVGRGGAVLPGECVSQHAVRQTPPPCEQNDRQMPVKILPCRSFVVDGKHVMCKQGLSNTILSHILFTWWMLFRVKNQYKFDEFQKFRIFTSRHCGYFTQSISTMF